MSLLLTTEPAIENLQLQQITKKGDPILDSLQQFFEESAVSIKELNVSKNCISDDDLTDFGETLSQSSSIETINLAYNRDITKRISIIRQE